MTIPRAVREASGLDVGELVIVEAGGGEVVVRRPRGVLEFEPPEGGRKAPHWPEARQAARAERIRRRTPPTER